MNGRTSRCRRGRGPAPTPAAIADDDELYRLARAFELARGREPTLAELRQIDAWAMQTRTHALLLPMVLRGLLRLDLDAHGQPVFPPAEEDRGFPLQSSKGATSRIGAAWRGSSSSRKT